MHIYITYIHICMYVCSFACIHPSVGRGASPRACHPLAGSQGRVGSLCIPLDRWGSCPLAGASPHENHSLLRPTPPHPLIHITLHTYGEREPPVAPHACARRAHLYLLALHWISSSSAPPRPGRYIYARGRASSPMITSACHTCSAY